MADAIEIRGLVKRYGTHEVVRGIDLDVHAGEVFGFLGPNGAGKTTTIEILEGYRDRNAGEVSVLGVDPARPTAQWRERVGLVLQECELDPLLTVREALGLFSSFYTRPRPIDEALELVGLRDRAEARIGQLSGGQKRRADVAIGLIGNPELIFLDEPTTGFDPSARRDAWTMIESLNELGTTVFLTTHYLDEAQHLADRVAILREGRIVALGAPGELGAQNGRAVISFRLPAGMALDALPRVDEAPLGQEGGFARLETADAQGALYRLLGWAEERGVELADLEVRRPTLEDTFLELTRSAGA
jgi:ABC-2 type transport system ATP-binding protein